MLPWKRRKKMFNISMDVCVCVCVCVCVYVCLCRDEVRYSLFTVNVYIYFHPQYTTTIVFDTTQNDPSEVLHL